VKTKLCDILEIEYPILQGGMLYVSGYRLVSAVSNAGGLGVLSAASFINDIDGFRNEIRLCRKHTDKPFGVNFPLVYRGIEKLMQVALDEGVKVFITSAGSPRKYTSELLERGIKVLHVAGSVEQAIKVEQAGCLAVIVEGVEAGGHVNRLGFTTFVLVRLSAMRVNIPVVCAGGVLDGRSLLSAISLGASGVQIGTRFALTKESNLHNDVKRYLLGIKENEIGLILRDILPTRVLMNRFADEVIKYEKEGKSLNEILSFVEGKDRMGLLEGDINDGEIEIGSVVLGIEDIPSAEDVIKRIVKEYYDAKKSLP
jgi:enoyl-[acyl-carrier protein] reductase II